MFAHGYVMLPDYVAIVILLGNVVFLVSLITYAILTMRNAKNISEEEIMARSKEKRGLEFIVLESNTLN